MDYAVLFISEQGIIVVAVLRKHSSNIFYLRFASCHLPFMAVNAVVVNAMVVNAMVVNAMVVNAMVVNAMVVNAMLRRIIN